jgi:hypothetical protein
MSVVSLLGVNVLNNPAKFGDSYEFEITFECLEPLQKGALCSIFMRAGIVCTDTLDCRSRMEVNLRWLCDIVRRSILYKFPP